MSADEPVTIELRGGAYDGKRVAIPRFQHVITMPQEQPFSWFDKSEDMTAEGTSYRHILYEFDYTLNGIFYFRLRHGHG